MAVRSGRQLPSHRILDIFLDAHQLRRLKAEIGAAELPYFPCYRSIAPLMYGGLPRALQQNVHSFLPHYGRTQALLRSARSAIATLGRFCLLLALLGKNWNSLPALYYLLTDTSLFSDSNCIRSRRR